MQYKEGCHVTQLLRLDGVDLSLSGYDGYPAQTYDEQDAFIAIEGLIYNRSQVETRALLIEIAADYPRDDAVCKKHIAEFIADSDREYLVLIYLKKQRAIIIFNDRWGRLLASFLVQDNVFAFSRELKFLLHWIPSVRFDRIAMAEFLIFGFNLGDKTLLEGVKRMNPAALLEVKQSQGHTSVNEVALLPEDFTTIDSPLDRGETIMRCVQLFRDSLRVRIQKALENGLRIVTDLSGGYDTRTVFAALCQTGEPFTVCTDGVITGDESRIAQSLADLYGKELRVFQAFHPVDDFNVVHNITYITDCMVNAYTAVSSYYDDLEREKSLTEPAAHFMGFGGEFIRHPYRPGRHYRNLSKMLEHDNYTYYIEASPACAMTKLHWQDFVDNLEYEVAHFPEKDERDLVKHLYFQYYRKMVGAGEDRHRLFAWTMQPLWGQELFNFEMKKIRPRWISYGFFIDFLKSVDRRALKVPIYRSWVRLDSSLSLIVYETERRIRALVRDDRYLYHLSKCLGHRLIRREAEKHARLVNEVWRIYDSSTVVREYFDQASIEKFLESVPDTLQAFQLLTLMSYVSQVANRFPEITSFAV